MDLGKIWGNETEVVIGCFLIKAYAWRPAYPAKLIREARIIKGSIRPIMQLRQILVANDKIHKCVVKLGSEKECLVAIIIGYCRSFFVARIRAKIPDTS